MVRSKVTRKDVAQLAGTSVAVVSYVVNNGPRPVAPATRERVLNAIKKTGYHPDPIAQALANGATTGVGLIVPNIANPFLASLAHQIGQEIYARGRVMLLADSADRQEQEHKMATQLSQQQVSGLIFYGVDREHDFIETYAEQLPIVVLDDPGHLNGVGYVRNDEHYAARIATEHLILHGYESVGIIAGPLSLPNSRERLDGWRDALTQASLAEERIIEAPFTTSGGWQAGLELLQDPPRAVFVSNELQAMGLLSAVQSAGLSVPDDLAVIAFNGTQAAQYSTPTLTTVEQPVSDVARTAVDMLTAKNFKPEVVVHRSTLKTRRSCGCRPNAHSV